MSNIEVLFLTILKLGGSNLIYKENGLVYSKADNHLMTASELVELLKELY